MHVAVFCVVLSAAALVYSQVPQPCVAPPQWTGKFFLRERQGGAVTRERGAIFYDSLGKRVAIIIDATEISDAFREILLFNEKVQYNIDVDSMSCNKEELSDEFRPIHIPLNATFIGEFYLGTSSIAGDGVAVESWVGNTTNPNGEYEILVTLDNCIPINDFFFNEDTFELVETFYYDIVTGITDPNVFVPPNFCNN